MQYTKPVSTTLKKLRKVLYKSGSTKCSVCGKKVRGENHPCRFKGEQSSCMMCDFSTTDILVSQKCSECGAKVRSME